MVYLLFAILCSFGMSLIMRYAGKEIKNPMAMYMANYVICIVLSLLFAGKLNFKQSGMTYPLIIGAISGALFLISLHAYNSNLNRNGLSLSATFNKLGILIPTLMAIFVFHAKGSMLQIIGLILAVISIVLLYFDKNAMNSIQNKGMLVYLFLASGICDSMANIYENIGIAGLKDYFLLFNFIFAFLCSFAVLLVKRGEIKSKDLLTGALIGIPNYLSSRFVLYSLSELSAIVVYPVYSVSVLVLLNISGVLLFKEEMNLRKGLVIGLICIALTLLNL